MSTPYLYLIRRAEAQAGGEHHALFAARVQHWPFAALAQTTWEDFEHPSQLQLLERQLRFISALHPGRDRLQPEARLTVELRYLHRPETDAIECALLGKACDPDPEKAKAAAQTLWEAVSGVMPVGYALAPAQTVNEFGTWAGYDLTQETQASPALAEIRRPADFLLWTDENLPVRRLPVVHPFAWQPSGWEAAWAALARLASPALIAVSLRPARLSPAEEIALGEMTHVLNGVAAEARPRCPRAQQRPRRITSTPCAPCAPCSPCA